MERVRIGIFKGSIRQLRQDLELCRQLRIPLLMAELQKESSLDSKNQEVKS